MPKVRKEIPELEKLVQVGRKKFVRYEEGAQLYSMGLHTFQELAKDAKAVYHVKRVVLVCKLRSNGMPVPLLRNCYSIFNGTKYR